ncbi:MAG: hypothetical protein NT005_08570 [Spirochaetes bacterium]|nr:hypothetical protein [Spirochaetota bacterium]
MRQYQIPFDRTKRVDIGVFRVDSLDPLQYYKGMLHWEEVCDFRIVVGDFSDRFVYQGQRHGRFEHYMRRLEERGSMPNAPLRESLRTDGTIFLCSPASGQHQHKDVQSQVPHRDRLGVFHDGAASGAWIPPPRGILPGQLSADPRHGLNAPSVSSVSSRE